MLFDDAAIRETTSASRSLLQERIETTATIGADMRVAAKTTFGSVGTPR